MLPPVTTTAQPQPQGANIRPEVTPQPPVVPPVPTAQRPGQASLSYAFLNKQAWLKRMALFFP